MGTINSTKLDMQEAVITSLKMALEMAEKGKIDFFMLSIKSGLHNLIYNNFDTDLSDAARWCLMAEDGVQELKKTIVKIQVSNGKGFNPTDATESEGNEWIKRNTN